LAFCWEVCRWWCLRWWCRSISCFGLESGLVTQVCIISIRSTQSNSRERCRLSYLIFTFFSLWSGSYFWSILVCQSGRYLLWLSRERSWEYRRHFFDCSVFFYLWDDHRIILLLGRYLQC
jgi:hypothetical protein